MNTRQIVHDILRDYPETRDDDKELLRIYAWTCWLRVSDRFDINIHRLSDFIEEHYFFIASHIRERAYWQNTKGMFLPSEWVKKARRKKQVEVVEAIREERKSFAQNVYAYAKKLFDKN